MDSLNKLSATAAPVDGDTVDLVVIDQIKLLYSHLSISQYLALVNAFILAGVHFPVVNSTLLISWLVVFCVVTFARLIMGAAFNRIAPKSPEIYRWREYFIAGS